MLIKNYKALSKTSKRKNALQIIDAGLEAIKTDKIFNNKVSLINNSLIIKNNKDKIIKINLRKYKRIFVIGFGKASSLMGKELEKILGKRIDDGFIISTKKIPLKRIKVIKGTHPMPSINNVNATKKMVKLIGKLDKKDLVLCLISGGGSALLTYPSINFNKYVQITTKAFKSGIDINALNKVRKRYSNVKGGKLAKLTKANIVSLIFSDVVGDDLATIASGPTFGAKNAKNILLLNNEVALQGMEKKAKQLGLNPFVYTNKLKGEAKVVGKKLLSIKKKCILFAGETTVKVTGKGKGGRCQELCLGALDKVKQSCLVYVGSDGMDGPTDAAGAVVDKLTFKMKIDPKLYLDNNDAYNFFKKTKDLVFTGLTGSNVADIGVIIK